MLMIVSPGSSDSAAGANCVHSVASGFEADQLGDHDVAGHDLRLLVAELPAGRRTARPATPSASSAARAARCWVGVARPNFSSSVSPTISGSSATDPRGQHGLGRLGDRHEVDVTLAVAVDLDDARPARRTRPGRRPAGRPPGPGRTASPRGPRRPDPPPTAPCFSAVRLGRQHRRSRRSRRAGRGPATVSGTAHQPVPARRRADGVRTAGSRSGITVSCCVSITEVTIRMAWIAGLAVAALALAGWRKTARAQPKSPRTPMQPPRRVPYEVQMVPAPAVPPGRRAAAGLGRRRQRRADAGDRGRHRHDRRVQRRLRRHDDDGPAQAVGR